MKQLEKISTSDEMQRWIEKLKNADGILPDGDFRWWQCPHCFHQGYHSGYHYRTMLRKPVKINGDLATFLRDLVVKRGIDEMNALSEELHKIWQSIDEKRSDFETWIIYYVEPWHMVKAACLTLKEKE